MLGNMNKRKNRYILPSLILLQWQNTSCKLNYNNLRLVLTDSKKMRKLKIYQDANIVRESWGQCKFTLLITVSWLKCSHQPSNTTYDATLSLFNVYCNECVFEKGRATDAKRSPSQKIKNLRLYLISASFTTLDTLPGCTDTSAFHS